MPGKAIPPAVVTEIQRQFNHELAAAHAYTALAVWCDNENLKGFASFFHKQSGEEREHAEKFMDHLLDRGIQPILSALPAPRSTFKDLLEIAVEAQRMEQVNTAGINAVYEASLAAKDYASQPLLQWFINEQVEEEAWTDEMVDRVKRANCAGGIGELDRHIERYLSDDQKDGD